MNKLNFQRNMERAKEIKNSYVIIEAIKSTAKDKETHDLCDDLLREYAGQSHFHFFNLDGTERSWD